MVLESHEIVCEFKWWISENVIANKNGMQLTVTKVL